MRAGAGVRGQGSGVRECDGIRRTWWFLLAPLPSSWGNASFYGIYGDDYALDTESGQGQFWECRDGAAQELSFVWLGGSVN
jgi:hypothetical protein